MGTFEPTSGSVLLHKHTVDDITGLPPKGVTSIFNQDYTILPSDYVVVLLPTPTDNLTFTLPTLASVYLGKIYIIKSGGSLGGFTLTVSANGSETIDGAITHPIGTDYDSLTVVRGESKWYKI